MTETILTAARAHWDLGDAPITLVAARENHVYRVDLPAGPAALRLHRRGYRSVAELRSELQWMQMLANHGLIVPAPIPAADGSDLLIVAGITVDLLTWLDGAPLSAVEPTDHIYFDLGCLMAQMHDHADAWQSPANFTRPAWDLAGVNPSWGRFWENPYLSDDQKAIFTSFREHAKQELTRMTVPDVGLIHADLVPDNVLIRAGQLMPIDFDDGGLGHRLFDVATVTFRSRRTDPTGALAEAVLRGYCTTRPLDHASLPLFEALRACSYVGWNIPRMAEDATRNARFIAAAQERIAQLNF